MKAKLNITVDEQLLNYVKSYASTRGKSVSALIEEYFKTLKRPARKKNIIDLVESLPPSKIPHTANLKELYYQQRKD